MRIPHGNVDLVRTFLRSLPAQYADYARLKKGIPEREVPGFVAQQIKQLRDQFHSGDELERAVFFTKDPYKPQQAMGAAARGNFTGCAFCHEVKTAANAMPAITKPILVDRWMPQANFNHAKHQVDPVTQKPLDCNLYHLPQPAGENRRRMHHLSYLSRADCSPDDSRRRFSQRNAAWSKVSRRKAQIPSIKSQRSAKFQSSRCPAHRVF